MKSKLSKHNLRKGSWLVPAAALAALSLIGTLSSVQAQNYSISWSTIDGGGGSSTGGVYSVSGTIGQPDAGAMSGGNYTVVGGFWGVIAAVQAPGAPWLRILTTSTNAVVIAWPAPSTGFVLQENPVLGSTNWVNVTTAPVTVGDEKQVIVSPPVGNRFYRLKQQQSWWSVAGVNYFLERGTDLAATPCFTPLATNLLGQAVTTTYTDTNAAVAPRLFYRVGVGN